MFKIISMKDDFTCRSTTRNENELIEKALEEMVIYRWEKKMLAMMMLQTRQVEIKLQKKLLKKEQKINKSMRSIMNDLKRSNLVNNYRKRESELYSDEKDDEYVVHVREPRSTTARRGHHLVDPITPVINQLLRSRMGADL